MKENEHSQTAARFPRMATIRRHFDTPQLDDVPGATCVELARLDLGARIKPGASVAVTAGSRGIANIAAIIRTAVEELRRLGAAPFLVPGMGSHGRGTAEGQAAVLAHSGVTEQSVGAPVRSSMEVTELGRTEDDIPVYLDKLAYEADAVLVVNRVKPHTRFVGEIESGLTKMMMIGLGKHKGAAAYHKAFDRVGFPRMVQTAGAMVLSKARIIGGLAILENCRDETARVVGVRPEDFLDVEKELLREAWRLMPSLPFREADLLIIDEIGKDISGSGMDTNIVGMRPPTARGGAKVTVHRIFVRDLSEASHGNALGIGLADFTTQRLVDKMDRRAMYANCLTARRTDAVRIPFDFDNDRDVMQAALELVGGPAARTARIRNTLQIETLQVSESLLPDALERPDVERLSEPSEMTFDDAGNLPPV